MPQVPSLLPQDLIQKQQADPAQFLMAAADLHGAGALTDPSRSAPMPKSNLQPLPGKRPRKFKVLK